MAVVKLLEFLMLGKMGRRWVHASLRVERFGIWRGWAKQTTVNAVMVVVKSATVGNFFLGFGVQ